MDRRSVLKAGAVGLSTTLTGFAMQAAQSSPKADLREIAGTPVLRRDRLPDPVIVQSINLLRIDDQFVLRVRSSRGAEGMALCNPALMRSLYPILLNRLAPFFRGKDARDLHQTQSALLVDQVNYKWQGLPFWAPHAWLELALLDLMGNATGQSAARLIGDPVRADTGLYYASGDRSSTAPQVVDELKGFIAETGSRAIKLRLGARLTTTPFSDARDASLIPLARRELGDDAVLYADANSSYDVPTALRIGRQLADLRYAFFEEPVLFDDYAETKQVADALAIPIAGGEVESSVRRFEFMIANRVVDVVQPDIIYFGGLTRAIRVARMAAARGMLAVPHMSGDGLGFLYALHFAAVVPNTPEYQEYKGEERVPYVVRGTAAPLRPTGGRLRIPQGVGLGVTLDPDWVRKGELVSV